MKRIKIPMSDLACERRRADTEAEGVIYSKEDHSFGQIEKIEITSKEGEKEIGRPIGIYHTLNVGRIGALTPRKMEEISDRIASELAYFCTYLGVVPSVILTVGLGNAELTPDAIGPVSARHTEATMYIKRMDKELFTALRCSEIAVLIPDVTSNSGMESTEIIKGVCERIFPDVVIAIDSLASVSMERLGSTIQICSTGIIPGAASGSKTIRINKETLGIPVIAIGVPTVINTSILINGKRAGTDGLFVSPKDVGNIVKNASRIIGEGINRAFGVSQKEFRMPI